MQHSTVEGTYLGDLEVKKEQIRNIVRAHKVCATLKNAVATKSTFEMEREVNITVVLH